MNDYIEVRFDISNCNATATDVLAALLCDCEYESFVPDDNGLTAYIKKELFDESVINDVVSDFPMDNIITYKYVLIEGQDWNSEWEKNYFKPIVVKDKCVIHSSFHTDIPKLQYDIVIDPGHGGADAGAVYKDYKEDKFSKKSFTLVSAMESIVIIVTIILIISVVL